MLCNCLQAGRLLNRKLLLALLVLLLAGLMAAAPSAEAQTRVYNGMRGFTFTYPKDWNHVDLNNVDTLTTQFERTLGGTQDSLLQAWNTHAKNVRSGATTVFVWKAGQREEFSAVDVLVIPRVMSVKPERAKELDPWLANAGLPTGAKLLNSRAEQVKQGSTKALYLIQNYQDPATRRTWTVHSALLKERDRSFLLSGLAPQGEDAGVRAVLDLLVLSLKDTRQRPEGLINLPTWMEMGVLGLVALFITLLLRRLKEEFFPTIRSHYSRKRRSRQWLVVLLFLVIWGILIGVGLLVHF